MDKSTDSVPITFEHVGLSPALFFSAISIYPLESHEESDENPIMYNADKDYRVQASARRSLYIICRSMLR